MSDKNLEPVEEHKCLRVTRSTDVAAVAIIVLHLSLILPLYYRPPGYLSFAKLPEKKRIPTEAASAETSI